MPFTQIHPLFPFKLHLLDLLCPRVYICIFPPNLLKVGDIVSLQHFVSKHPPTKNSETIPPQG